MLITDTWIGRIMTHPV